MTNGEFTVKNGTLTKYSGDSGTIVVPKGVTSIGYRAFSWNSTVTEMHLPDGIVSIQTEGICGCDHLRLINLPQSLTKIGGNALRYTVVEELMIPDGVTEIAYAALNGCRNLERLHLPAALTKICDRLLCDCEKLKELSIPHGVTYIGRGAFAGSGLRSVVIPDSVTFIGADAFRYCEDLISVEIPDSVTAMGGNVFRRCPNVTVYTTGGSYTEKYAKENGIPVVIK